MLEDCRTFEFVTYILLSLPLSFNRYTRLHAVIHFHVHCFFIGRILSKLEILRLVNLRKKYFERYIVKLDKITHLVAYVYLVHWYFNYFRERYVHVVFLADSLMMCYNRIRYLLRVPIDKKLILCNFSTVNLMPSALSDKDNFSYKFSTQLQST